MERQFLHAAVIHLGDEQVIFRRSGSQREGYKFCRMILSADRNHNVPLAFVLYVMNVPVDPASSSVSHTTVPFVL
jgi:hypothetical protein